MPYGAKRSALPTTALKCRNGTEAGGLWFLAQSSRAVGPVKGIGIGLKEEFAKENKLKTCFYLYIWLIICAEKSLADYDYDRTWGSK